MSKPVVYSRLQNVEKVIDKIVEDTKKGGISWKRCENKSGYSLVSKDPIKGRKVFLGNSDKMLINGNKNSIPFIYEGKGVRKLYRIASYDVMPEDVEEWVKMMINSN